MSLFTPLLPAAAARSADLWRTIEDTVREACLCRAESREREAVRILQQELPPLVGEWSRACGLRVPAAQQALRELIARVQQQVAEARRRLVVGSLGRAEPPSPAPAGFHLRRRIPIGDIPAMLDALGADRPVPAVSRRALAA